MDREKFRQPLGRNPRSAGIGTLVRDSTSLAWPVARREPTIRSREFGFRRSKESGGQQRVVQLVGVARIGTLLVADALDGIRVEHAHVAAGLVARRPRLHGLRPPLLERRIVQERVRLRVEDLVREGRRLRRVARDAAKLARVDAREHAR